MEHLPPRVRQPTCDRDVEAEGPPHDRAHPGGHLAGREGGPHVQRKGSAHALQGACTIGNRVQRGGGGMLEA